MEEQKNRRSVKATIASPTRPDLRIAFVKGVSFLALVLGLVLTSVASADDPNLVGWWKLDEGQGQTAYDSAGNNDGTIYGATWTTGKFGGALDFNGSNSRVNCGNDPTLQINGSLTLTFWIYPRNLGAYRENPLDKSYGGEFALTLEDNPDAGRLSYYHGTQRWSPYYWGWYALDPGTVVNDDWQFIAITRNVTGRTMKSYYDGQLKKTDTYSSDANKLPSTSSYNVLIGDGYSHDFNGKIDDVRIFDRALSEQEIQAIMQGGESQLPGFRAPLLDEPASPSSFRSKVGQGPSGQGPGTDDSEIQELARGLRYDPGLMYKFVHDYIEFYPIWGDIRGPYMTWMDRSGNGFDQASLMIALLKEAEQHCTEYTVTDPNYVVGEIQLSETQAFDWLRIVDDAEMARQVLARAGLYGSVTEDGQGGISNVKLEHVWVKVKIDGNDYEFDPSFKSHTAKSGLFYLGQAMGYNQTNFLNDAEQGSSSGDSWIKDLNKANIHDDLTTYSTNLISYIKTNLSDGGLADVIGGRSITPASDSALPPSSLPYEDVLSRDDEFAIENVPNLYRTSLHIQHCGIDKTFWSSDIYGRRLTLRYNVSNQPELVLDGTVKATGNATTPGQDYDLTLSVDHPYDSSDFDGTTTRKVTAGGFYQIVNGWGDTGTKILEKHRDLLEQYLHDGLADNSEEVLGESFALVGLTWLAQTSRVRSMACEVGSDKLINHHMLGVTGQYETPYIDMPIGHLGVYSYDDPNGVFLTIAGHAGGYEHEVIRQLQDCNAVSTVQLLEMANDRTTYDKVFKTSTSNWSSIQSELQDYSQDEKDLVSEYVDDGFTVHLPQYGNLSKDDWTGIGFQAVQSTANCLTSSYIISGGYSGGAATGANEPLSPSELFDRSDVFAGENEGTYHYDSTDLTVGNGGLPFGLSFGRQYSSQRRLEDGPLGLGWTHNFDITAKVRSDSFQVLGEDSPIDAAAHIVALYVARDILTSNSELVMLKRNMIASLCETWLMDQMMDNLVTIEQGGEKMQFTKVPDDSYNAPQRRALKLVVEGDDTFLLKNSSGKFYGFDANGRMTQWSDAHGNVVDFTYTSGKLSQVAGKIGGSTVSRSLSLTYSGDHIITVTDSASRSISYTYDANDNLTEYENPDENVTTYDYDDVNDGQLTKVFSPVDQVNPFLTNVYDSLGRLKQQIDANNCTVDYYLAGYRAETLEPEQTDPNNNTARFSTVVWANEDGLPIHTLDQLGREATYKYDGHQRVKQILRPSGTWIEYTYDENHHVEQTFNMCKGGSPPDDPNTVSSNEYDSYENSEGRWFSNRTKYVDPNGYNIYYEYDYNDVGYGTEVGNLMKVTYPEVDAPSDTNTPIIEFTYNAFGLLETRTHPEGMVTKFEYYPAADGAGLKKTIADYGGTGHLNITTELTYDNVGNVATTKDPRGNITQHQYYASRLLKKTIAPSPFNYETTYEYYADGKLKHIKKPPTSPGQGALYLQSITYTARGQKDTVKGPYVDGNDLGINLTDYDYDALGRLWKVTDAENNVTKTRYYPDGQLWRLIDALDHNDVTNTYNPDGSLQKVEDAKGNATEYEYNGFMGLKKTTYADGSFTEPYYDPIRRLEIMRTRAGQGICVAYDDLHRVKTKQLRDVWDDPETVTNTITYKYDLAGKVLETTDNTGTIKNTYDTAGRLIQIEYPGDKVVSYEYDAAGNRTKLTYPDNSYITYEYDQLNRLTKIRNQASTILASYTYDVRSRRTNLSYANGTNIGYHYDTASRLLSIDNQTGPGPVQYKYAYTYDKVGNRLSMLFNDSDEHIYSYDQTYQVTDVNYPESYEYLASDTTFNYDDASNRTSVINGGTVDYVSNEMNQYSSVGAVSYDYDQNGNLTYDATCFYSYDAENRLTEVTRATGGETGPLSAALDTDLSFTTGGDANWAPTTAEYYYDGDSAQSAEDGSSWLETTVIGEGTIQFYKKISSGGLFYFTVDGRVREASSGPNGWLLGSYGVQGLGTHTLRWSYSGDGTAWVDYMQWTSTDKNSPSLQEALDVGWPIATIGGYYGWSKVSYPAYNDGDSAKSGPIDHEGISQMQATVEGEGTVTFWWKVSSEEGDDYLKFKVDGVLKYEISGEVDWQEKEYTLTGSGSHSLLWEYVKNGSVDEGSDCGWVDWLQGPGTAPPVPDPFAEVLDCDLSFTTGGDTDWEANTVSGYYGGDSAWSGSVGDEEQSWLQTTVEGEGTVTFWWKVYSEEEDYLEFYIDSVRQDRIDGEVYWEQKQYNISGSGSHTLKWRYIKDGEGEAGDDGGSVDWLQWSGSPPPDPTNWDTITYTYDPAGRRIKKNVVGSYIVKYVYDGDHVIAEYDNSNLLRKYIYGARVDEPVCMLDVADNNAAYYYHFDGLGSVVALSDSTGEVVEQYVYDVFGQPALQGSLSTFGNTQVFSSSTTSADRRAMSYTMPEKGNIQSICIYHEGGTGNLLLAVYNDNGSGKPGTRLGVTESTSINGSAGWQTVELTSPVDVAEGQTIWLAWVFSNNPGIRYTTGSPGRAASGVGWSGGMPGSFGSSTTSSYIYSIYAKYTSTGLIGNPYMFTGRRFDIETGLYYYRARYYNPHIGRFMQTDPVGYGDGINWYLYCRNNPLAFVDPMGLANFFYDPTVDGLYELTGDWNLEGISLVYNVTPGAIDEIQCGEDTIYLYTGTIDEKARYSPEDMSAVLAGENWVPNTTISTRYVPYGDSVQWITGQFLASWTGSFYRASGLVWDSDGNVGWINVTGGGGGTPNVGVSIQAGSANANDINAMNGLGFQAGGSWGVAVDMVGGGEGGNKYAGIEVGATASLLPIPEGHGLMTHATVYPLFNTTGLIIDFLDIFIDNPYD